MLLLNTTAFIEGEVLIFTEGAPPLINIIWTQFLRVEEKLDECVPIM